MERGDISVLIEKYGDSLYRYCKSMAYTVEDAEDLYQQTFLKALELHKKISLDRNPCSYLMAVATRIWQNHKSSYARHERIAPTVSAQEEGVQVADVVSGENVLEQLVKREELAKLKESVNRLPDKQRQVVLLFYAGERPVKEIAKILRIPEGTVKSRLNKARRQLRREMEGERYE